MKTTTIVSFFLLLTSTVIHANNAATQYQFGYETGYMTKEEKAALIQSQTIIRLNPMRARIRNVDNGGAATMVCDESSCTVTPIPWPEPLVIFDSYNFQSNPPPRPNIRALTPQEKFDNTYSLALDGPGVLIRTVEGATRYSSKCKRDKLTKAVQCRSPYLLGGTTRSYLAGTPFRQIWRVELGIRTLLAALDSPTSGISQRDKDIIFNNLEGGGSKNITFDISAPPWPFGLGKPQPSNYVISADRKNSIVRLSPKMLDSGQGDGSYVGVDGKKYQFSALRTTIHEVIHVLLQMDSISSYRITDGWFGPKVVTRENRYYFELQTVILTNKVLKGIEKERGFYRGVGQFISINTINELATEHGLEQVGNDFVKVSNGVVPVPHRGKLNEQEAIRYLHSPIVRQIAP